MSAADRALDRPQPGPAAQPVTRMCCPTVRGPLAVSPPVRATVAGRRVLTSGGALPVAVAVPVLLGLATAVVRYRRWRQS
jgi:hypothetical protein